MTRIVEIMGDICAWLTANGITPGDVPIDAVPTITDGQITVEVYQRNADGQVYAELVPADSHDEPAELVPAMSRVTVPLVAKPPPVLAAWLAGEVQP